MMGGILKPIVKPIVDIVDDVIDGVGDVVNPKPKPKPPAPKPKPKPKPKPNPPADDPADPVNPSGVVYSETQDGEAAKAGRRRKKKGSTIMTGAQGVIGDAPVEKSTLLGGG
tara:strand:- start:119 stop:454 length:336 start_codon:yes stop_codon:yes gene_type:complete